MLKVENINVYNIENAMRGMRNPLNSWKKNDTKGDKVGENDLNLSQRLLGAGEEHAKFMRQVMVSIDITAPLYWWKEFDQYKIGTTTNSCSTMHKIHAKEFTIDDFSMEHLDECWKGFADEIIEKLNQARKSYEQTSDKKYWWQLVQLLPSSYNQKRTWTGSYANLRKMYQQRNKHKLDEWHTFINALNTLPMVKEWIMYEK